MHKDQEPISFYLQDYNGEAKIATSLGIAIEEFFNTHFCICKVSVLDVHVVVKQCAPPSRGWPFVFGYGEAKEWSFLTIVGSTSTVHNDMFVVIVPIHNKILTTKHMERKIECQLVNRKTNRCICKNQGPTNSGI